MSSHGSVSNSIVSERLFSNKECASHPCLCSNISVFTRLPGITKVISEGGEPAAAPTPAKSGRKRKVEANGDIAPALGGAVVSAGGQPPVRKKTKKDNTRTVATNTLAGLVPAPGGTDYKELDIPMEAWDKARATGASALQCSLGMRFVLEIYAGCMRLTGAAIEQNLNVVVPIEKANGPWSDVSRPEVQAAILSLLESKRVWYCHLATPCTRWSRARRTATSSLDWVVVAFTVSVLKMCRQQGIFVSLENPAGSGLFTFGPVHAELEALRCFSVRFDCCAWGANYKKATELWTNYQPLTQLARRCSLKDGCLSNNPRP